MGAHMDGKKVDLSILLENWPSPYVARSEVRKFSGGILHPRTMANLDALNKGPKGRIRMGRKVFYLTTSLVTWMEERAGLCDKASFQMDSANER